MDIITLDDINNINMEYKQRAYALNLDIIDLEFEFLGYFHQLKIKDWNSSSPKYILMINSNIFIDNKEELIIDIPESIVYLNNDDLANILEMNKEINIVNFLQIQQNQLIDYNSYFKFFSILKNYFDKLKSISFPILEYSIVKELEDTNIDIKVFYTLVIYLEDIELFIRDNIDYKYLYNLVILNTKLVEDKENTSLFIDYCTSHNIQYMIFNYL